MSIRITLFAAVPALWASVACAETGITATTVSTDTIYASSIVTTPIWKVPDYVFEPDYKRTSLSEIDSFVRENHHLPEMPSTQEVEAKGMDLAEMNLRLLKAVEELTLHVIDLDKELRWQQVENSKLSARMQALQTRKVGE